MRLHLNKKLRAALIAAISTVGTTLPLAQAAWEGGANEGSEYYTNTGRTNLHLTNTSDGTITFTAEQDHVTAGIAEVAVKDLATVRVRGGNHWGSGRAFDMLTIDSIKAGDGSGTVFVNAEKYDNSQAASNSTATVLGINGTLGGVQNYGVLTLGASGSSINASGLLNNNAGGTLTINGSYVFDVSDISKYTLKSEGSVEWSDATYSQGFKKSSGSTYYAIKGATDGANIGSITDSTGTALTRESSGNYYFTVGAGDFDYTKFYVKADTATLNHDGTGQIIVERNGATLTVEHATYRDTSGPKNLNIVVGEGGVLEVTHSGQNGFISGTLEIQGGGILRVAGSHDAFGWGTVPKSVVLEGEQGKEARLEFNQTTGNSATFASALTMKGYANITSTKQGGSAGFNTYTGCSITAENTENYIEVLDTRRSGVTITVKDGGELTVKKQTINSSDNSAATVVVKQGEGTLFYTGDTKAKGLNIQAGTVDFSSTADLQALTIGVDGTMKVSGGTTNVGGTANVIGNTIELTGGELKLGGTYDISDLELQGGGTTYVGGDGIATGNGFAQTNGSLNVVHVDGGTLTLLEGVVFNYNAAPVTVGTDGVVTLPGTVSYSALHVNNGNGVSFNSAWNIAQEHTTDITGVVMADGTNIDLDKDGATFGLTLKGSATLKAAAGATTTIGSIAGWQDGTLTVTGEGAVILPSGTLTLSGTTKLDVQGKAATGKLVLNNGTPALSVAAGASLNVNGDLTPSHGTAVVKGIVNISGSLDLSNGGNSDVKLNIGSTGVVTAGSMWMAKTAGIDLAEGGTYNIANMQIVGKEGGSITTSTNNVSYGSNKADFFITNAIVTATANVTLGNTLVNSGVVSSAHQVTLSNASSTYAGVTVSGTGSLVVAADSNIAGTSSLATGVTINGANTLTNSGTMDINGTIVFGQNAIQNTGAITFGDDIHFNLLGMTAVDNKYTLFSGNAVDLSMYDTSRITVAGGTGAYKWTFGQDGTISYASISYTWNGGAEGVWDYETPCWNDPAVPFQPGLDAQFDSSATVAVKGEIVAGQVTVSTGNEVTLTEGEDGYLTAAGLMVEGTLNTAVTVEADSYTVAQGGTWNIQGDQLLGDGINEGTIHVDTTGDVIVFSAAPETVLAGVENDGHIGAALSDGGSILNMGESSGTLEVYSGAVSYLSELGDQTVMLDVGTKLLFGDNAGTTDAAVFANDIVLNGDASVQVWGSSKHSSATISGDVSGEDHTLTKTDGDQSLVFSGVVTLGGLTTASDGHGTIVFNGGEGSVGYIKALNAVTIQFSAKDGADNIYSFESFNMSSDDNQTNATRWLVVDSDVTLNGTGTSRKYGSTIENSWGINGGGLEINGTLNTAGIIAMDAGNTTAYIKGSGLINTKGLDLCNYTKTYIQDGITINITSDTGIYKRNNNGEVHLLNATLQATDVDWAIKDGGSGYKVTLDDTVTGTTFDVAADRTITIANILGGEGKLVKTGAGTLVLSNNNTHTGVIDVREGKLVVEGTIDSSEVTLGANASLENKGSSPITLSDVDEQLKQIENLGSSEMTLRNTTGTLEVEDLTIGADSSVSFYKSAAEGVEGTITVTDTLNAGGGTLKANLTIIGSGDEEAPTQLNLGGAALTLGSKLTVDTTSGLILLDADTIAALEGLALGHDLDLFKALEETQLNYGSEYNGTWFDAMFVRTNDVHGDYRVYASDTSFGLTKVSKTPEPTTGTLSLLALAALAARRRRH
ncbi:MAG: autotransporter-associated beta strand repeat-containing protein [Akkermansia sp.]|nr:autotransporter-associated beta strand repeat-containing protein [Akkermansia sp.]